MPHPISRRAQISHALDPYPRYPYVTKRRIRISVIGLCKRSVPAVWDGMLSEEHLFVSKQIGFDIDFCHFCSQY